MASLNLTLRQRKLLHTIQNRKDMITGQELAGLLNASARTIRSDVVTINHELKPYGASIDSVRSKGYFFTAEDPDKIRELNRIETAFFTREDRIRALALELCIAEEPLSCFDLEDEMFISRTTLENDIRLLRLRYMMNGPKIRIITGHNDISFEQDELKRRQLLSDLYMEHWNYNGRGNAVYGMSYLDPDLLDRIIDRAYEKGMRIVLNPSPFDEALKKCDLKKVSLFLLNEIEAEQMTGEKEAERALDRMRELYPEAGIVLTLGALGSVWQGKEGRIRQGIYQVKAVDTTAAGDTFTGYFISSMIGGLPAGEGLSLAAKASAIAVTRHGAADSIPLKEEVLKTELKQKE